MPLCPGNKTKVTGSDMTVQLSKHYHRTNSSLSPSSRKPVNVEQVTLTLTRAVRARAHMTRSQSQISLQPDLRLAKRKKAHKKNTLSKETPKIPHSHPVPNRPTTVYPGAEGETDKTMSLITRYTISDRVRPVAQSGHVMKHWV